jgi:hypothetical protein
VVEERRKRLLLPVPCGLPYAVQHLGHTFPVLRPACAVLVHLPLGFPCSAAGDPALFARFCATMAGSDSSGSFITGSGSSPSRCGPAVTCHSGQSRGPRFPPARSVRACQDLRPRRVEPALALSRRLISPSAYKTNVGNREVPLSRLNGCPTRSPVNTSRKASKSTAHDSGPM